MRHLSGNFQKGRLLLYMTFVSCREVSDMELPAEAKQFLRAHIQSLEQLEILALMRAQREREWSATAIYEAILSNEKSIGARLAQFANHGLVVGSATEPVTYRYWPRSPELDIAVQITLQAYRDRRVLVAETIFRPDSDPAKSFADAFRFK
jgi:hypothetical protein